MAQSRVSCFRLTGYVPVVSKVSKDIEGVPKGGFLIILNDHVPLTLTNPKSLGFNIVSRTTIMPSFKSFQSGVFVLLC